MRTKFESLPNEILLIVLANLSSLELLTSLWWLNKRVDVLICSILSRVDNCLNSGLAIIEPGLSFNECHSLLFHSISTLHFGLQRIYFDGTNYIASDLSYELLFDNDKNILRKGEKADSMDSESHENPRNPGNPMKIPGIP
ncbi:unnamed protein product [Rotaria magnacalcarata]|uniref:F-box domain-containing protein n=1 Tax=Rotaria magnacalcarata TaxID=392030 RepID=A0A814TPK3_9BILA|nr:unnamed protein product [Rotaria magnacalcarata]CAF1631401.1 unnamed protein product [Rotaria magnacalcarata]CAF4121954.1 unnamed protein product [Rotaria magnacalcarata]CAF4132808.1 unnamed protein product [Rotaria magnacalcarata]